MRKVIVENYQDNWEDLFQSEAIKIKEIFKDQIVAIHHIGSTSVKGLKAKPIIDIMTVVKNIDYIDQYNSRMFIIGYRPMGENGIGGRRYFQKGGDLRTHHVHVYKEGNFNIARHLAFRDYLRSHQSAAESYGELKTKLAKQFPTNIDAYIKHKNDFVKMIEEKALVWYQKSHL